MDSTTTATRTASYALAIACVLWAVVGGLGGADWIWTERWGATPSPIWPIVEGIWAGSSAGQWLMVAALVGMVPRRTLVALLAFGFVAEVALWWHANLLAGARLAIPTAVVLLLALRSEDPPLEARPPLGAGRWLVLASLWFIGIGGLLVFDFDGPLFARYREQLWALGDRPAWALVELAYARIGLAFTLQYLAVVALVWTHGPTPKVLRITMAAQLLWFCTDSPTGLSHGAAFNVLQVNLPAFAAFAVAWGVTWRGRTTA